VPRVPQPVRGTRPGAAARPRSGLTTGRTAPAGTTGRDFHVTVSGFPGRGR